MLKATLLIAIVGMATARIPILGALLAIVGTALVEITFLALRHGHVAWHYSAGLAWLTVVGELSFFAAAWLLYDTADPKKAREKARLERLRSREG